MSDDDASAIDGAYDAMHASPCVFARCLERPGNIAVQMKNAWTMPRPRRPGAAFTPAFRSPTKFKIRPHSGLSGKKLAAQFVRIFSSSVSPLLEKPLDRKAGVAGVADGAPPFATGTAEFRSVQVKT